MRPFEFRAQAALELRRREHDDALRRRAAAEAALAAAEAAIADAEAVIVAADHQRAALIREPVVEYARLQWHQAWRLRCVHERTQLQARRSERDQELQQATLHVSQTHRRVRSLERLREHAQAAWARAEQHEERKTMDALATSRFVQEEMR
jgi:flagellar biosynthesis chaperone FliJ